MSTVGDDPAQDGDDAARKALVARLDEARSANQRLRAQLERAREAKQRLEQRLKQNRHALDRATQTVARLEDRLAAEQYLRIRRAAEADGVAEFLLAPHEDGSRPAIPGYARKPSFLPERRGFVGDLVERGWARPTDRVLDIGCGIGAVGAYLVPLLGTDGSYVGLDVDAEAIAECRRHFSLGNFSFDVMDVFSSKYNEQGRHQPSEYQFPFADGAFDLAIMRSLFTHMLPADVDHYLAELARLLAPGGRIAATFLLLDDTAEVAIASGTSIRPLSHRGDGYRVDDEEMVEAAVAIDEAWVRSALARHGFEVAAVELGNWRTSPAAPAQDTVFAARP